MKRQFLFFAAFICLIFSPLHVASSANLRKTQHLQHSAAQTPLFIPSDYAKQLAYQEGSINPQRKQAALVMYDIQSNQAFLLSKNGNQRVEPASTAKVITALMVQAAIYAQRTYNGRALTLNTLVNVKEFVPPTLWDRHTTAQMTVRNLLAVAGRYSSNSAAMALGFLVGCDGIDPALRGKPLSINPSLASRYREYANAANYFVHYGIRGITHTVLQHPAGLPLDNEKQAMLEPRGTPDKRYTVTTATDMAKIFGYAVRYLSPEVKQAFNPAINYPNLQVAGMELAKTGTTSYTHNLAVAGKVLLNGRYRMVSIAALGYNSRAQAFRATEAALQNAPAILAQNPQTGTTRYAMGR